MALTAQAVALARTPRKPRVVHVISGLGNGGAEATLVKVCIETSRSHDHIVVSLTTDGHQAEALRAAGVEVLSLGITTWRSALTEVPTLWKQIRQRDPDVVQTWMYHADVVGGLVARLAVRAGVVWGVHHSAVSPSGLGPSTWRLARIAAVLSAVVPTRIAYCAQSALDAHEGIGYAAKGTVIPNGFDVTVFRPPSGAERSAARRKYNLAEDDFVVGCVARWHPIKGHEVLLKATQLAMESVSSLRLLLIGPGCDHTNSQLQALIERHGLKDVVRLAGPVSPIHEAFWAFDINALASWGEAMPNVVAEAMASALPNIATRVGDVPEMVAHTGWLVNPGDAEAISAAVLAAYSQHLRGELGSLGYAARDLVTDRHSLSVMSRSYIDLWRAASSTSQ